MKGWRYNALSCTGKGHERKNEPCQDTSTAFLDSERLVLLVADGAGSAKYGGEGSKLAVTSLIEQLRELPLNRATFPADLEMCLIATRQILVQRADELGVTLKAFATTILGTITTKTLTLGFQIGDGAIIYADEPETSYSMLTRPEQGLYPNETFFLTSTGWLDHLQVTILAKPVKRIALFSDGLQELALVTSADFQPLPGFFNPFFELVKNVPDEAIRAAQIKAFLSSDRVCEKTHDDKSLALAMCLERNTL